MPFYHYRATDETGKLVTGTMYEVSARKVKTKLEERGLTVETVDEIEAPWGLLRVSDRLTWDDLELLTAQIEMVVRAGLPLCPALQTLREDLRHPRLKPVLEQLRRDLDQGSTLEEAVARQAPRFPRIYPPLLRAGEASGNLAGVLQIIANHAARMSELRHRLRAALAYPEAVLVASVFIVALLLIKVAPVFEETYRDFGIDLPIITRVVMGLGTYLRESWPVLLGGLVVLSIVISVIWRVLQRWETSRCWLDAVRQSIFPGGYSEKLGSMVRFTRTLSVLLSARVPIVDALELAGAASGSARLERAAGECALQVAGGDTLSSALRDTNYFGSSYCWLLGAGEKQGRIEEALDNLARMYERDLAARDRILGALLSPVLIVALGIVVGAIIVALYLPIFIMADMIT
jgi:type IV pilus assembly protein PilC